MNDFRKKLYNQTPLKILSFLSTRMSAVFSAGDVQTETKASKGAVNHALKLLFSLKILSREKKGNLFLYKINSDSALLKQFKIFETLFDINEVLGEIKPYCRRIVLYGSCAGGLNNEKSDIDIFIESEYKGNVQKIVNKYKSDDLRIQAVIQDPLEIIASKNADKVFFEQVKKGIILWEGKPVHEAF